MSKNNYILPTAKEMAKRQDEDHSLRLLLAQRRLYSRAKLWLLFRIWGMGAIAIFAPIVAFIWPDYDVIVGAIAGGWIFLGRSLFYWLEKNITAKAAAVQEMFDIRVFKMPHLAIRSPIPTLEEIATLAGDDSTITSQAKKENLLEWYSINAKDSGLAAIAICQRINTSYSRSLLNTTSKVWLGLIVLWAIMLIAISIILELHLDTFLLAVMLPLLPAFLDMLDFWRGFHKAGNQRNAMTQEIETKINNDSVSSNDLLLWQTRMYELRRDMPLVPDSVYKLMRRINERAMKTTAKQLSDQSRSS